MQEGCVQVETAREKSPSGCSTSAAVPEANKGAGSMGSFWLSTRNLAPSVPGLGVPMRERSQQPPREVRGEPWWGMPGADPPTQRGLSGRTLPPPLLGAGGTLLIAPCMAPPMQTHAKSVLFWGA